MSKSGYNIVVFPAARAKSDDRGRRAATTQRFRELLHYVSHVASLKAIGIFRENLRYLDAESLDDPGKAIIPRAPEGGSDFQLAVDECLKHLRPRYAETFRLLELMGFTSKEASK